MAAPKGTRPPAAGKGRVAGSKNKLGSDVKAMILGALESVGGAAYLAAQAEENPAAFMSLVGKVLPLQVNAKHEGQVGLVIERRIIRPGDTNR